MRKSQKSKDERIPVPVPGAGWCVVARLKGPLPELHRRDFTARLTAGTIATRCGLLVREVAEVPEGTLAHLCQGCR